MRRSLSGGLLGIAVLLWAPVPAVADEAAAKIKEGIEWYLQSATGGYPGVELKHEIEVTAVGDEYEVAVNGLTLAEADPAEGQVPEGFVLGDFLARVKPLENGDYRFHSVRVPEEIRFINPEDSADSLVIHLGLEKFEGVMSPRAGYASAYDFVAKDMTMTLNSAMPDAASGSIESAVVRIAELTSTSEFQEPKANAVEQDLTLTLRDVSADIGGAGVLRIGRSTTDISFSSNDVTAMIEAQESLRDITTELAASDPEAELAMMRTMVATWKSFSRLIQRGEIENLTYDSPDVKVGIEVSQFGFELQDLDSDHATQDLLISSRGFFVSLPTNPAMDAALQMLPRRWTLPVKVQRIPVKAIFAEADVLLSEVSSPDEIDQGGPRLEAFSAKIGQLFREAGTTILLDGQSIESDTVTATMDGSLLVNPDNPIGVEGTLTAQALGLMQLFEKAQTLENPQAQQQVMQGAMVLLSTGETEPGNQVPSVTNYLIEFTPEGAVNLNGNQMVPPPGTVQ